MENKIYYTEDIINELEKKGHNKELVTDIIKFYISYLRKDIENTGEPAYYIPNFGTIYLTLTSVNYSIQEVDNIINKSKRNTNSLVKLREALLKKRDNIQKYIDILKNIGNKKIAYFEKSYDKSKFIKNA